MLKKEEIQMLYERFANLHRGSTVMSRDANKWVAKRLSYKLNMCISDFAKPECDKKRCNTKEIFVRVDRGYYTIK